MKKFKDLKVGDTVYNVIFTSNSNMPIRVKKKKVIVIEKVHSGGTVIKTEDIVEEGGLQGIHGYFVGSRLDNAECMVNDISVIWWDKFAVQELINNHAVEYQRRFSEMLDALKD